MPHRNVGTEWRCTTDDFNSMNRGDIVLVIENVEAEHNRVFNKTQNRLVNARYSMPDNQFELAQAAPAPVLFEPNEDEKYVVLYRATAEYARRQYGPQPEQANWMSILDQSTIRAVKTLEQAEASVRGWPYPNEYELFVVPLRAVQHWHRRERIA